ncbi:hypothetical protein VPH35_048784 [Triticum aestivum]
MAAAGGPPERPSSRAVSCDLQACTTEPAIGTGTAEKESAAEYNQKEVDDNAGDGSHGIGGDGVGGDNVGSGLHGIGNDGIIVSGSGDDDDGDDRRRSEYDDDDNGGFYRPQDMADYISEDDGYDERDYPPPSHMICYNGDSKNLNLAYSFSKYRVELFIVRPRFRFTGSFAATDGFGGHFWSSQRGHTVDPQNNLILESSSALTDTFWIKIKIPGDNGEADDHYNGNFSFTVNPYACNKVITRTISTRHGRKIDMTFMALHKAIQANVYSVVLFSCGEENKAEVIDGELPLSRKCVAVPIYMEPLLILYLDLQVATHCDRDNEGHTIAFRDYITFYPDQYVKRICSAEHGKVKVRISYQ